jgi:hypothetical protein
MLETTQLSTRSRAACSRLMPLSPPSLPIDRKAAQNDGATREGVQDRALLQGIDFHGLETRREY